MSGAATGSILAADASADTAAPRHSASVRVTHWVVALCFFALLLSGVQLVISHPRFYWGEEGHVLVQPLFTLPIPASRPFVPTGYDFVLPDQNGWSRSLHFQSAWILVFAGLFYVTSGVLTRHFQKELIPRRHDLAWAALSQVIADHLRFKPPGAGEAWSYNTLQRLSYLGVVFVLFPLMIWTGLAMSPAFTAAFPETVNLLGGRQSARTIHFFVTLLLSLFLVAHVLMVWLSGFTGRVRAMITGRGDDPTEVS